MVTRSASPRLLGLEPAGRRLRLAAARLSYGATALLANLERWTWSAAGRAGGLFESMPLPQLFGAVAASALVAGLALAVLIKPTVRMMSGVK